MTLLGFRVHVTRPYWELIFDHNLHAGKHPRAPETIQAIVDGLSFRACGQPR